MSKRPKDLPRADLLCAAEAALEEHPGATLHFKFTCQHCGHRCMLASPNTLYESGECDQCGKLTKITQGGFALFLHC